MSANFQQTIPQRLAALRAVMAEQKVDAILIPSSDPHISEYLPGRWQAREFFSGFTGSVANLIVTQHFAGLWVDGRYWTQAENELVGSGIDVMRTQSAASEIHFDWLATNLQKDQVVSLDGNVFNLASSKTLGAVLQAKGIVLKTNLDLVDLVWDDRPALPLEPVYEHVQPFAVTTRAEKLELVRAAMREKNASLHFISTVDDVAWLLNLRGSDIQFNPIFMAHALVSLDSVILFARREKFSDDLLKVLADDHITVQDYDESLKVLAQQSAGNRILIDPRRVTLGTVQAIANSAHIVEAINPSVFAKSRKIEQEIEFVRQAMEQDGAALCEFFAWLESALNHESITELTIDEKICAARARQAHFVCPSFNTIAGFNANGALPHYRATPASHAVIQGNGLLLIDSGGQYLNGTTDITRVIPVGETNQQQRRDYTLVLKGMINLSRARFPRGIAGPALDALARAPIWADLCNYSHGTGHGVGYFMNVHEGPQTISQAANERHTAIEVGMITSNEPGLYRPGMWGVRIENLVHSRLVEKNSFGEFLEFETLTLCPIDTRCIDMDLINQDEIDWLNHYHSEVRRRLSPRVSGAALSWLELRTTPISK